MNDRLTKLILIAIALGLWANVAENTIRRAAAGVYANEGTALSLIANGQCVNQKLC